LAAKKARTRSGVRHGERIAVLERKISALQFFDRRKRVICAGEHFVQFSHENRKFIDAWFGIGSRSGGVQRTKQKRRYRC
jgi:hypothetical protein